MEVRVELFGSRVFGLEVDEGWCVRDVLNAIAGAAGVAGGELRLLLEGRELDVDEEVIAAGITPFCTIAAEVSARREALQVLKKSGTPVGIDALMDAVKAKSEGLVATLLTAGADVNAHQAGRFNEATPLHLAASLGYMTITKMLLARGADPNARDFFEETPMHDAARNGHLAIVLLLVNSNASLDPLNSQRRTPLMECVERNNVKAASLLLAAGCDRDIVDANGARASAFAKTKEMFALFPNKM